MSAATAYAPYRYHRVHLHPLSLIYAPTKGWVCSSLKGYSLNCITFRTATDPTSGSGSLLINIGKSVSKYIQNSNNIKYYAQELKENTYNLTRMNLIMRGISPDNLTTRCGDTLEEDWPNFDESNPVETYEPLYVDAVVSNPPYSQAWDPTNKETQPRYAGYGLAPKGKADYAFLLHDLFHIKSDGIMTIVLPHGVLFRGGEEGVIRKKLIERNNIDTIIGLPANIFFGTGIPTIIMVLKQPSGRTNTDVLIIDASKGFVKDGKNNKLRASDIKRISDTVIKRESVPKFAKLVSRDIIRANDYNLNIPRYVDSSESAESWDVYASMFGGIPQDELDELNQYWTAFPKLRDELFEKSDIPYVNVAADNISTAIMQNADVIRYKNTFAAEFSTLDSYLKSRLLVNMSDINVSQEESILSADIFSRLKNIPLIDKYEAYQLLDDDWTKIAVDLEIVQTEGFEATKKVDPNIVLKKKDGKDIEVQEGWIGHIIPFELVQQTLLKAQYEALKAKETRLSEIPSELEEIIDTLSEEEKDSDFVNETSFAAKEITKKLKELRYASSDEEKSLKEKLTKADTLLNEDKALKTAVKKEDAELQALTKTTIESLSDEQVTEMLEMKWIAPLCDNLNSLPNTVIGVLVAKVQALQAKYAATYFEVEKEIKETEQSLCSMIDDLCGNEYDMKGLAEFKSLIMGE